MTVGNIHFIAYHVESTTFDKVDVLEPLFFQSLWIPWMPTSVTSSSSSTFMFLHFRHLSFINFSLSAGNTQNSSNFDSWHRRMNLSPAPGSATLHLCSSTFLLLLLLCTLSSPVHAVLPWNEWAASPASSRCFRLVQSRLLINDQKRISRLMKRDDDHFPSSRIFKLLTCIDVMLSWLKGTVNPKIKQCFSITCYYYLFVLVCVALPSFSDVSCISLQVRRLKHTKKHHTKTIEMDKKTLQKREYLKMILGFN